MRRLSTALALAVLLPAGAGAQTLSDEFNRLFTFGDCGEPLCLPVNAAFHGNHYIPGVVQGQNNLLAYLNSSIGWSLSNIPVGSATSAEVFSFVDGLPVAEQVSSGPIFGERAPTLGQGNFVVSGAVTGLSFKEIRGVNLSDIGLTFVHQNVGAAELGDPSFEQDIIRVDTDLTLDVLAFSVGATVGLTNRIDLGVAVPFVSAKLSGQSTAQIIAANATTPHAFGTQENPSSTATASADGSASGIGDIVLRLKGNVFQSSTSGFALLGEVRLPTGAEEDFLGAGETTMRALGVYSARRGNFSPHLNGGVSYRTGEEEGTLGVVLNAGFDQLVTPRATLAIDLLGNLLLGDGPTFPTEAIFDIRPNGTRVELTNIPDSKDNLLDLAVGGKLNATDDLRLLANIIVPLNSGGLRPGVAWTAGLEFDFR